MEPSEDLRHREEAARRRRKGVDPWWVSAMCIAAILAIVLPGRRIGLGASKLRGLIGSAGYSCLLLIPDPYDCGCPECHCSRLDASHDAMPPPATDGGGPQFSSLSGDPVDVASGGEAYRPDPDIVAYNPTGPSVSFRRSYDLTPALYSEGSPGLAPGWSHNYDVHLVASDIQEGYVMRLEVFWPNTSADVLSAGSGGAWNVPAGSPYTAATNASTGAVVFTWNGGAVWTFTSAGDGVTYNLTGIVSPEGALGLTWNSTRELTAITDANGNPLLTLSYSGGCLSAVTDATGRQVSYTYSGGELQSVSQVGASGGQASARWTYGYGGNDMLASITVPSPTGTGNSTGTIAYNYNDSAQSRTDANGNQTSFSYNSTTTQVAVQAPRGGTPIVRSVGFQSIVTTNNPAQPEAIVRTGDIDAKGNSTQLFYQDSANPKSVTKFIDKDGATWTKTYDSQANVTSVTDPREVTTTYTWSYATFASGRLMSVQQGTKTPTTYTYYEPSGLVHTVTTPAPGTSDGGGTVTSSFTYSALGNILTATGPGNGTVSSITTTYNYTTDGTYTQPERLREPLTVTDNLGHTTHYRYDSRGNVVSVIDALGIETDTTYNVANQVLTVTYPATQTGGGRAYTTYAYVYPGGPLSSEKAYDESGNLVRQMNRTLGPEGELLSVSGSVPTQTYTYDALYRVLTQADGKGNTTQYAYDAVGNLASMQYPGGQTISYPSYNAVGHPLTRVDGNGVTTNYLYNDPAGAVTDIQYPATPGLNVHFGYDTYGRRNAMTDSTGSTDYLYDDLDELLTTDVTYAGLPTRTLSYSYNPDGSRQTLGTPAGGFGYSYDGAGRPVGMTNPNMEATAWSWLDNNWLWKQTSGSSVIATYSYNARGFPLEISNKTPGGTSLSDFGLIANDSQGNITSLTASIPAAPTYSGQTSYGYDSQNELLSEQSSRLGGYTNSFGYDAAGNPTSFKGTSPTFNSNNQNTAYTFDGNGNPTVYKGVPMVYDPENRLTSVGSTLTAGYTGDSLRAWKQSASGRTYFLYDGTTPILELNSAGTVTAVNTFGANALVSRHTSAGSVFYAFDAQGSVSQRLDSNGNVLGSLAFDAFGSPSGALSDPFGYEAQRGYYTDVETGLELCTFRYYDPSSGRFLTLDPIGYGANWYAYCGNDPVNSIDPDGLQGVVVNPPSGQPPVPPWKLPWSPPPPMRLDGPPNNPVWHPVGPNPGAPPPGTGAGGTPPPGTGPGSTPPAGPGSPGAHPPGRGPISNPYSGVSWPMPGGNRVWGGPSLPPNTGGNLGYGRKRCFFIGFHFGQDGWGIIGEGFF